MQDNRTRYPSYDVLKEQEHWDEHTREIVKRRLEPSEEYKFLKQQEAELLRVVSQHIVYEERPEILSYVVHHIDNVLASPIGEDQRKIGTPPREVLLRQGLQYLDQVAQDRYGEPYLEVSIQQQLELLQDFDQGKGLPAMLSQRFSPKSFFKKMATQVVSAYYSHPIIWSEIGYGGPAYPRGYVRVEKGLTDPWEARQDAKE